MGGNDDYLGVRDLGHETSPDFVPRLRTAEPAESSIAPESVAHRPDRCGRNGPIRTSADAGDALVDYA
ncbi:hypothetical protein QW131_25550 [Roseibium salinum]|nr:hypothetical protein [Roseibium salinum]